MIAAKPIAILAAALAVSVGLNLWQFRSAGKASARCDAKIAQLAQKATEEAAARDDEARRIARDIRADAEKRIADLQAQQSEVRTRVQTITRTVEVPAGCPVSLPDRVRDALADAAAAANR